MGFFTEDGELAEDQVLPPTYLDDLTLLLLMSDPLELLATLPLIIQGVMSIAADFGLELNLGPRLSSCSQAGVPTRLAASWPRLRGRTTTPPSSYCPSAAAGLSA